MTIIYDPKKELAKIAPESKLKKLMTKRLSVKKAALSMVDSAEFINKKSVNDVAIKVVRSYQMRVAELPEDKQKSLISSLTKDPKLLIARVQNHVITQIAKEIRQTYGEEMGEWLPSDAEEPDPEHQLNYGKTFLISEGIDGELPGDRIGCRCGLRIFTKGSKLELG